MHDAEYAAKQSECDPRLDYTKQASSTLDNGLRAATPGCGDAGTNFMYANTSSESDTRTLVEANRELRCKLTATENVLSEVRMDAAELREQLDSALRESERLTEHFEQMKRSALLTIQAMEAEYADLRSRADRLKTWLHGVGSVV